MDYIIELIRNLRWGCIIDDIRDLKLALNTKSALTVLVVVLILGFEGLYIRVYYCHKKCYRVLIVTPIYEYWTTPILTLLARK